MCYVCGAALSALVFHVCGRSVKALSSIAFVLTQQPSDGSFLDVVRGSHLSTLDTGWVTVALQQVQAGPLFSPFLSPLVFVGVIILVGVVAVLGGVGFFLLFSGGVGGGDPGFSTTGTLLYLYG